ncbi:MAG: hypothetical protein N4A61_05115 [Pelagimonas sp.]|jgi:hypothetical protein|nr:hypothetical protein [Pelagimonas sp.]
MAQIEILGLSSEGLRIGLGRVVALVPNALLTQEMGEASEARATEWASALQEELGQALEDLRTGRPPARPFDQMLLLDEG